MLRIKRASAGSGKTYELAKFYIKLLISTKQPGFKRQLLKEVSFKDSLSSIMAVTFTVKATAEMKQRIVEKLADLASADNPALSEADLKGIDYLDEFIGDFRSNRFEIADLSRRALRALLLNYSDFKVQTIDSFFQSILHTFVYEASLDDNFNMEIDTDMVTTMGFGAALDDLSEDASAEFLFWLKKMMSEKSGGNKWNVFTRDDSSNSLYSDLIKEAKNLDKEEYQQLKDGLFNYFESLEVPFREVVDKIDRANLLVWKPFHDDRREKALILKELLEREGLSEADLKRGAKSLMEASVREFDIERISPPSSQIEGRKAKSGFSLSAKAADALEKASPGGSSTRDIDAAFSAWAEANNRFYDAFQPRSTGVMTWLEYRALIPKLMIVLEIARRKEAYLKATNSLQISDTAHILSKIIGDDDAPFVYERMGSRLDHFLIDEFQDTSAMQWRNFRPLIDESESHGHDNLIIGDAKQSIYRFRNADSSLISNLENQFSDVVYYTQETEPDDLSAQNTNYRSKRAIVEFNNYVFGSIVDLEAGGTPLFTSKVREVYSDCRQAFPKGKGGPEGFVDVLFYQKAKKEGDSPDDEGDGLTSQPGFASLPERIMELRGRGYRFRDIGILVRSHTQGMAAVSVISAYNSSHPEAPVPVISEEDLLVSSALSVKIVVQALEMAAHGMKVRTKANPVIADPVDEGKLFRLLRSLNTLALPSVVEAVIGQFVPRSLRSTEAPFIAAFYDAVLDYCMGRPGDIGSFLKWWRQKSGSLSITSSEESDGVRIQTIHKAKGLEYDCVIIPMADFEFVPPWYFSEWRWVPVDSSVEGFEALPDFLPVVTRSSLASSAHAGEYVDFREEFALDELNKMYVAFTRAATELYIYVPFAQKDSVKAGGTLRALLVEDPENELVSQGRYSVEADSENRIEVRYGSPSSPAEILKEQLKRDQKALEKKTEVLRLSSYEAPERWRDEVEGEDSRSLLFHNDRPLKTIVHPDGSEEEIDPRAEGTLKHRILQMVNVPDDLDKALLRMKTEGLVSDAQVEEWGRMLKEAIESVADRGWFARDVRVFNERPVLMGGRKKVPDRFVVSPEGDAVIIDYKFGEDEEKYEDQIQGYAALLRAMGRFRSVSAFLWYVPQGKIVPVGTLIE